MTEKLVHPKFPNGSSGIGFMQDYANAYIFLPGEKTFAHGHALRQHPPQGFYLEHLGIADAPERLISYEALFDNEICIVLARRGHEGPPNPTISTIVGLPISGPAILLRGSLKSDFQTQRTVAT